MELNRKYIYIINLDYYGMSVCFGEYSVVELSQIKHCSVIVFTFHI